MTEELRIFLADNCSPELYDLIIRAFQTIDELYGPDIQTVFQQYVFTQQTEQFDTGEVLSGITELVKTLLINILKEHTVIVSRDIDLKRLIILTEALIDIQTYEDVESILRILHLDTDNEEKLSEVLALVAEMDQHELLLEIESVDKALLDRLIQHIEEQPQLFISDTNSDRSKYLNEIREFEDYTKDSELIAVKMLKDQIDAGYLFEVYANILSRRIEEFDPTKAAKELVGLCYISVDGFANPKATIAQHIHKYVSDLRKITTIDIKVTELLLGYQQYKDKLKTVPVTI